MAVNIPDYSTICHEGMGPDAMILVLSQLFHCPLLLSSRDSLILCFLPYTHQRCLEGSNIPCSNQDLETPQRLSPNCVYSNTVSPVEVWVSSGLPQWQGLWVQQSWVWHKTSWRRFPITPQKSHQNLHRTWGNRLLEGTNKTLCTPRPRERSRDPTGD